MKGESESEEFIFTVKQRKAYSEKLDDIYFTNIVVKSDNFSKMVDNLEQTEISTENNIEMLALAE